MDEDITSLEKRELEKHLSTCKICQKKREEFLFLKRLMKNENLVENPNKSPVSIKDNKKVVQRYSLGIAALFLIITVFSLIVGLNISFSSKQKEFYHAKTFPMGSIIYYEKRGANDLSEEYSLPMDAYFSFIDE